MYKKREKGSKIKIKRFFAAANRETWQRMYSVREVDKLRTE